MSKYIDDAVKNGDIDAVKYMYSIGQKCTSDDLDNAAGNGDLEMVKFLISVDVPCYVFAINNAAINGHINVVRYLYDIGKICTKLAIETACIFGHYDIVSFDIYTMNTGAIKRNLMKNALFGGHLNIVKMLHMFVDYPTNSINIASHSGNLELIKYLYNNGEDYIEDVGNIEIMTYLKSIDKSDIVKHIVDYTISEYLTSLSIQFDNYKLNEGYIKTIEYLYYIDIDCVIDFINYAAIEGDIVSIKYLYNKYKKCNMKAMYNAAENGHLDIVKYMHDIVGLRYSIKLANIIVEKGYLDILKLIDIHHINDNIVNKAVANNHIDIVKYLYSSGVDCSNTSYIAVKTGNINMIDYLVSINVDFYKFSSKNDIVNKYLSKYSMLYK
jgi:ankyrin repeat protein